MGPFRSAVAKLNKRLTVRLAASLLAGSTLLSSLIGIYRDRLLNSMYLDSYKQGIDAYTVAFSVPDFMFFLLVSGALSVTFVPVFTQQLTKGKKDSAWHLSSSMINFMALTTLFASILIILFADQLVNFIMPAEFDEARRNLTISLMRVIAVNPFLFAIATVIASIQQAVGRFVFFALAPILYNVGIIAGALFFTNGITLFGNQIFEGGIMGVALGVVLGAILQLLVSAVGLLGLGFDYEFKIYWKDQGFLRALRLLPARSLDQGMDYIIGLVEMNLAGRMAPGVIRSYQQASALHMMPINLIGVAISTAAFPKMSEHVNAGHVHKLREEVQSVLRAIVWIILPVATITFFARNYVASFLKNGGDPLIAGLLGALVVAIFFRTVYHLFARVFYAHQDTKTPLYVSIFAIALNIALAVLLTMHFDYGPYGLAYAQSIVAAVEVVVLAIVLQVKIRCGLIDRKIVFAFFRMLIAGVVMSFVTYEMVLFLQLQSSDLSMVVTIPKFVAITLVSMLVYVVLCRIMQLREAEMVFAKARQILFGRSLRR